MNERMIKISNIMRIQSILTRKVINSFIHSGIWGIGLIKCFYGIYLLGLFKNKNP